jgi:hypothetical protein
LNRRDLLLALAAAGAAPSAFTPYAVALPRRRAPVALSGVPAEVPMTLWRTMPAVQALVNGRGPFTLGIDTGYPALLTIGDEVARACELPVIGRSAAADPSGVNPVPIHLYRMDELRFGALSARNLEASGGGAPPTAIGLDGFIGLDLFHDCVLQLDFPARRIRTSLAPLPAADGRTRFDFGDTGSIDVPVRVGEVTLMAMLDTGQVRSGLIVAREDLGRLPVQGSPRSLGLAHTVSQTIELSALSLSAPVRLGDFELGLTEVAYPPPIPVANLGAMALQDMIVTLDQLRRRVGFSRG